MTLQEVVLSEVLNYPHTGPAEAGTPTRSALPDPNDARLTPSGAQADPALIGRYRIIRRLGQGGFGRVYLAWDDELDRPVAVKVPNVEAVAGPQDVERYLAEARMVAKLDHPQIVPVYDVGRTDDGLCYVQGVSRGRVDLGGCPPRPPTDPDVRVKRIWLFIS